MTETGHLSIKAEHSAKVEWKIESFLSVPTNYELRSPRFNFSNTEFYLRFHPDGEKRNDFDWISMYLMKGNSLSPITVSYTIGIKRANGAVLKGFDHWYEFKNPGSGCGAIRLIRKSEFLSLKDVVDKDGTLWLYCSASVDGGHQSIESSCSLGTDDYKKETKEFKEKSPSASEESEAAVEAIKNLYRETAKEDYVWSENFKELYFRKGDTTVKVADKDFLVHKRVLVSRSSVFRVMFETDMAEKNDGVVNIKDCEPEDFMDFLLFLYGGQFGIVRSSNALKLCSIADKYNVVPLKKACFEVMKKEISVDTLCDAVYLATLHEEEDLLNTATEFFIENMGKIVRTPKWFSFLSEHTATANELLIQMGQR